MERVKTFDLVKSILESVPETRDDDFELIRECSKRFGLDGWKFAETLTLWRYHKLPTFEGITRARRKVQEMYPSLRASDKVAEARAEQEREYADFYRR